MSIVPVSSPATDSRPALSQLNLHSSFVLTYPFPEDAFITTSLGTVIDGELATTLWTTLRLIASQTTVSDELRAYCLARGLAAPPAIFAFDFHPRVNLLRLTFQGVEQARQAVHRAQEEGLKALDWMVRVCEAFQGDAGRGGLQIPIQPRGLLDYYRSLTWPGYDEHGNTCRALIPYAPPPYPSIVPRPADPYSPLQPFILDGPPLLPAVPTAPPPSPSLPPLLDAGLATADLDALLLECFAAPGLEGVGGWPSITEDKVIQDAMDTSV